MTDHPRFQRPKGDFESSYHDYYGAPLVSLILRPSAGVVNRRTIPTNVGARAIKATGQLFVLLGVLAYFVYAFAYGDAVGAAPASAMKSPTVSGLANPVNADQLLPGKFMGYQGLFLP